MKEQSNVRAEVCSVPVEHEMFIDYRGNRMVGCVIVDRCKKQLYIAYVTDTSTTKCILYHVTAAVTLQTEVEV